MLLRRAFGLNDATWLIEGLEIRRIKAVPSAGANGDSLFNRIQKWLAGLFRLTEEEQKDAGIYLGDQRYKAEKVLLGKPMKREKPLELQTLSNEPQGKVADPVEAVNVNLKRLFGFLLILAAAAGFIFSLVGLFEIWRYQPVVTQTVVDTLALFDQTLNTTQDGLAIVGQVVQATTVDVASLQTTTQALAQTIHNTNPMLDSLTNLTSKDFPAAVAATQASLTSAQSSALLIDNVLEAITSIPLLPVTPYKPDVPLHTALAQVSTSLNSLTPALATINASLIAGRTNLDVVEAELNKISETSTGMSSALESAQTVIDQYKTVTTQLKMRLEAAQRVAPGWITTISWILSFVLGWLLIAQLGMCAQGLDMLRAVGSPRIKYAVDR